MTDQALPRPCPHCLDGVIGAGRFAHDCTECRGHGQVLCVICRERVATVHAEGEDCCLECDAECRAEELERLEVHTGHASDLLAAAAGAIRRAG